MRDSLLREYTSHYRRVSAGALSPTDISAGTLRGLDKTYGELVTALPEGSEVLDLGCGTGAHLSWLSTKPAIVPLGVDASETQIEVAQRSLPEVELHCSDGRLFLEENPNRFSGIFCFDVLEHIHALDEYAGWFEAILTSLKPDGFFCCRTPNAANLTAGYSRYIDLTHERIFTAGSLLQLFEIGGFARIRILPIRSGTLLGRTRQLVEYGLHRAVFLICGRGLERVFTSNVCAVGYKPSG